MDSYQKELEIHEPDFSMLGLKFELIGWLSENGLNQFVDYQDVEADCGNAELQVRDVVDHDRFFEFLRHFAMINNLKFNWQEAKGAFKLWRYRPTS